MLKKHVHCIFKNNKNIAMRTNTLSSKDFTNTDFVFLISRKTKAFPRAFYNLVTLYLKFKPIN